MAASAPPRIYVLAGVNGAGKSSIAGAAFRENGADYYNPDEAARALLAANPGLRLADANGAAWRRGFDMLERAITQRLDFAFETTLGASSMPRALARAAAQGFEIYVWYAGLATPELHLARVRARVSRGGHDIPEAAIRRRFEHSRINLIALLPRLAALRVYDNSAEADPADGKTPRPELVLHLARGRIRNPENLSTAPEWAKPVVAAALRLGMGA
jgi:predicted ABC-type ATPase